MGGRRPTRARVRGEAAVKIRVEGLVQRVGFRRFAEKQARSCRLVGSVENLKDGSARIFAQGESRNVTEFVRRLGEAPPPSEVRRVQVTSARVDPSRRYFEIRGAL